MVVTTHITCNNHSMYNMHSCMTFQTVSMETYTCTLLSLFVYVSKHKFMSDVCHMWQSRVEIEGYSVAYFDCIAAFEAPYH